ncbi:MAG TPA: AAA family ATPase [Candidatus Dormibacteraeota bacterium]|nr:AAA family ATPase [Candidatus Dormibacteraeota bacterium]
MGRERELQAVDQALAAARLGKSARLVIRGEPGIGKTALLEHAVARAASMRVLSARGVEFEADVPFAGLHELLRPALEQTDRLSAIQASALRSSLGLGDRIEADRLIVGAAVLGLICAYAEPAPLLVILDDAHWLDRASAEAIVFAARRLVADPVAVVVAVREGEGGESPFLSAGLPELSLAGLDAASAAELVRVSGRGDASRQDAAQMLRATGGNPLALIELSQTGAEALTAPLDDLPVATTVERSYLRRADGLSQGARAALLLMAASGSPELALVRRAAVALGIAPADIEDAESVNGLTKAQPDRAEFVHPLARAAIYHAASPAQRRATHRALATVMTDLDDVDRRAWHLAAAASGWDEEAADALESLAQRARESTAYDAAASALAQSARLTEAVELRAQRLFHAAENAWLAGRAERATEHLTAARKLTHATDLRVDIDHLTGHIGMRRGALLDGYRTLTAAAQMIEPLDRLKAIRILADAALSSFGAGHPSEMLVAAAHALELVAPADPPEVSVLALVAYGSLAILAGKGSDGPKRLHESIALFDHLAGDALDPLLLMCAGTVGLYLREAEAGRQLLDRALTQAREHAPTAALPNLVFFLGRDAAATDRWPLARAQYEEAARLALETTQYTWFAGATAGLAWLDALEGREDECRAHAAEGSELSERYGMSFYKAWVMIALGQLELGLGRPDRALEHFSECAAFLSAIEVDDPDLSPAPDIVEVLVRLGRSAEARQISDDYRRSALAKGQPFALARSARAEALLAKDDGYAELYEVALRHHAGTSDVFERARTQLYFGERLRRNRRRVDARRQLREALKVFDQLGASPWSERALAELQASGETATVREDRYRRQLTPQELQVAVALAEGATTREAAARLYLSPKTVEYHLRHVYDKLEVRTRDDLRTALVGQTLARTSRKALLFTDLARSTNLVEAIGDEAWQSLSGWLDKEMRRCFQEQNGREVDHAGDGFFVLFDSAADAIQCAISVQRRLSVHRRQHGYAPQMRIGIHAGEVSESDSSVRGAAVHRAARLCAAADPDTILVSREALEGSGRKHVVWRKFALKGFTEPMEAAEIGWQGAAAR